MKFDGGFTRLRKAGDDAANWLNNMETTEFAKWNEPT